MQVACDREQPGPEASVGIEARGMRDQTQPRLLEQVLGHIPASREPDKKPEQAGVVHAMHDVKCVAIAGAHALDERQLGFAAHTVITHAARRRDVSHAMPCRAFLS